MNIGKLKGPKKILQMAGKLKFQNVKAGFHYIYNQSNNT
jgi:hypothetical protein